MYNGDCMERKSEAVFDTGPLIHLHEIQSISLVSLIKKPCTTQEVKEETVHYMNHFPNKINIIHLKKESRDFATYLMEKFVLGIGETTAIALAKQEKIALFFTDDLDARTVATHFGFKTHGTIGIILRALKNKLLTKKQAEEKIQAIGSSSLFITKDLIAWTLKEIQDYKEK